MKLSLLYLSLSILQAGAHASYLGGAYGSIMMWYVYRMEVVVYGVGGANAQIATQFRGNGYGDIPNQLRFDEFLRRVQQGGLNGLNAWTGHTKVGAKPFIEDIPGVAVSLQTGFGVAPGTGVYSNRYDFNRLLPRYTGPQDFPSVLAHIQSIIRRVTTDGYNAGHDLSLHLKGLKLAIRGMKEGREIEKWQWNAEHLENAIHSVPGLQNYHVPRNAPHDFIDGFRYFGANYNQIQEDALRLGGPQGQVLSQIATRYSLYPPQDAVTRAHDAVIQAATSLETTIHGCVSRG